MADEKYAVRFKDDKTGDIYVIKDADAQKKIESLEAMKAEKGESYTKSEEDSRFQGKGEYVRFEQNIGDPSRKVVNLPNHVNICGYDAAGTGSYNIAMVSKWDVADFGSNKIHLNLNSKDPVTLNDHDAVITESSLNAKNYATKGDVQNAINGIINGAGEAYDTLREIQDIIDSKGDASLVTELSGKMTAVEDKIDAITPKAVTFDASDNEANHIHGLSILKYACPERYDDEPDDIADYDKDNAPIYARDGDFAFPAIDGTGQINMMPIMDEGYVIDVENCTLPFELNKKGNKKPKGYKAFKTPYFTGIRNCYRITKVTENIENIKLVTKKESEYAGATITYNLSLPEGYSGAKPTLRVFRSEDAAEKYLKYGKDLDKHPSLDRDIVLGRSTDFADGNMFTDTSYNEDTGYADENGIMTFIIENIPTGYNVDISTGGEAILMKKGGFYGSKTKAGTEILLDMSLIGASVRYIPGAYAFSDKTSEIPAKISKGNDLLFYIQYRTDGGNASKLGKKEPSAEETLSIIKSVKIDGVELADRSKLSITDSSGKKRGITLAADAIGDAKTIEISLATEAVYDENADAPTAA